MRKRCTIVTSVVLVATACGDNSAAPTPDAAPACVPLQPAADDCSDSCFDRRGPVLVTEITPAELGLAAPPSGSTAVRVGLFYTVAPQPPDGWTSADAVTRFRKLVVDTNEILVQCGMHVEVEAAQVVALPARLLDLQGNEAGSFGGHPPPGTSDPDLFDYQQDERLTAESRELFEYGKRHTSKNAISAFTVSHIVYYSNQQLSEAGGLSNPPNIYHHVDDYPYRNSVVLVPAYGACGSFPDAVERRTLAHELGHMLLNSGGHSTEFRNLMNDGTRLTATQCATMSANLERLYGKAELPDPGPPS